MLTLKFWGVRGSMPTPHQDKLEFGGNTPCIEVRTDDGELLIFDAGTGISDLGRSLAGSSSSEQEIMIFLSHFHWDHIQGLPFFEPIYRSQARIRIFSSEPSDRTRRILETQMGGPFFPVKFSALASRIEIRTFDEIPGLLRKTRVETFRLNHPQGATGFRIENNGSVIVLASDHEPGNDEFDGALKEQAHKADLLIADTHFTPDEFLESSGWGHGTWRHSTELSRHAHVKQLALFHHNPFHTDDKILEILSEARTEFPATTAAREQGIIQVG